MHPHIFSDISWGWGLLTLLLRPKLLIELGSRAQTDGIDIGQIWWRLPALVLGPSILVVPSPSEPTFTACAGKGWMGSGIYPFEDVGCPGRCKWFARGTGSGASSRAIVQGYKWPPVTNGIGMVLPLLKRSCSAHSHQPIQVVQCTCRVVN